MSDTPQICRTCNSYTPIDGSDGYGGDCAIHGDYRAQSNSCSRWSPKDASQPASNGSTKPFDVEAAAMDALSNPRLVVYNIERIAAAQRLPYPKAAAVMQWLIDNEKVKRG